jgi:hypothetical protein
VPPANQTTQAAAGGSIFADLPGASSQPAPRDFAQSVDLLGATAPAVTSSGGLDELLGATIQPQPTRQLAADPLQELLSIPPASSGMHPSSAGQAGILQDLGMDGIFGAGGLAGGADGQGSHLLPSLQTPANSSSASSLLMDLQSAPGASNGANVLMHGGVSGQGPCAAGGAFPAAQAPAGGLAAELGSVYGALAPAQRAGGVGGALDLGTGAGGGSGLGSIFVENSTSSIAGAAMPVGIGGGGGMLGVSTGLQAGPSHATRPTPTPSASDTDIFAGLGGLSSGAAAGGQGNSGGSGALDGMFGGAAARGPPLGTSGSSLGGALPLPDASASSISAFGALLNPEPPPLPEVSYDWALSPTMLASVGAPLGAQPAIIHTSEGTGIKTAALVGMVGDEARLLLQFRESRGSSGRGSSAAGAAAVRYHLPANTHAQYLGEPEPAAVPAADGAAASFALPPLPWPRGVTHVLRLQGAPLPPEGEQLIRVRVALICNDTSDLFEVARLPSSL